MKHLPIQPDLHCPEKLFLLCWGSSTYPERKEIHSFALTHQVIMQQLEEPLQRKANMGKGGEKSIKVNPFPRRMIFPLVRLTFSSLCSSRCGKAETGSKEAAQSYQPVGSHSTEIRIRSSNRFCRPIQF